MAVGGVRYRAVGRAGLLLWSPLPSQRPPPAGEEEGEEDLVEGETARGQQHQHQPRSQSACGPPRYQGLRSPPFDLARWGVQPVKLVVGDSRPFWGVGQKLGLSEALLKNGLRGGAGVLTGDAEAQMMTWQENSIQQYSIVFNTVMLQELQTNTYTGS